MPPGVKLLSARLANLEGRRGIGTGHRRELGRRIAAYGVQRDGPKRCRLCRFQLQSAKVDVFYHDDGMGYELTPSEPSKLPENTHGWPVVEASVVQASEARLHHQTLESRHRLAHGRVRAGALFHDASDGFPCVSHGVL